MTPATQILLFGSKIDADALTWRSNVVANGGSVSPATLRAVSNFAKQCKLAGIWSKINRLNLFCGDQLAACLVPLKVGAGSATDANTNFVSGDYTQATGLTGNGSTKYLDTGLPQNTLPAASRHLMTYERVRSGNAFAGSIGAESSGSIQRWGILNNGAATTVAYSMSSTTTGPTATSVSDVGTFIGTSSSGTAGVLYINGVSRATSSGLTAATPSALTIFVFALNQNGSPFIRSAVNLCAYSIGEHLTSGDVTAYNSILETFQDSLGRGVQ